MNIHQRKYPKINIFSTLIERWWIRIRRESVVNFANCQSARRNPLIGSAVGVYWLNCHRLSHSRVSHLICSIVFDFVFSFRFFFSLFRSVFLFISFPVHAYANLRAETWFLPAGWRVLQLARYILALDGFGYKYVI